jgi:hypothetical protein
MKSFRHTAVAVLLFATSVAAAHAIDFTEVLLDDDGCPLKDDMHGSPMVSLYSAVRNASMKRRSAALFPTDSNQGCNSPACRQPVSPISAPACSVSSRSP